MTAFLPPSLLVLFEPRPPLEFLPPPSTEKSYHNLVPYNGVGQFIDEFSEETPEEVPDTVKSVDKKAKGEKARKARAEKKIEKALKSWDPKAIVDGTEDAYKTLFVARLNYGTDEKSLKRAFEQYGPVRKVRIVTDRFSSKPRGYGFIEFDHESDMKQAYKMADGRRVDGSRVLVDVERGRTVKNWKPRKFGGGLGSTRANKEKQPKDKKKKARVESASNIASSRYPPISDRDRDGPRYNRRDDRDSGRDRGRSYGRDRDSRDYRDRYRDRDRGRDRERRGRERSRERGVKRERDEEE